MSWTELRLELAGVRDVRDSISSVREGLHPRVPRATILGKKAADREGLQHCLTPI